MTTRRPQHLGALILATALIPPMAVQFEFGAATGVMAVATMHILRSLMKGWLVRSSAVVTKFSLGMSLVFVYLLAVGLMSWRLHPAFDSGRFVQSLILMIFCLTGAYHFSRALRSCTEAEADRAFRFVFMIMLVSSLPRMFGIHLSGNSRSAFFYNEPSHYALGVAPFLLYMVVSDAKRRWLWLASAAAVGLAMQSLTLLVIVLLIFAILMRRSFKAILFILLVVALGLAAQEGLAYYTDRAMLSSESTNLSNLVYLSGWERAQLSLDETRGLGYGLNQLGIVGDQGTIMATLSTLNAEGLNAFDGGSVASKLIAEFGVGGLLLLSIYAGVFLKGVRVLRSVMHRAQPVSRIDLFFWSCLITFSVDLFVRGAGYFSAESFMFFGAMWGLTRRFRRRKNVAEGRDLPSAPGSAATC